MYYYGGINEHGDFVIISPWKGYLAYPVEF